MKPSKLSFLLILITSALLLNGVSKKAEGQEAPQAQKHNPKSPPENKRTESNKEQTSSPTKDPKQAASISNVLQKISAYCASNPDKEEDKWLRKFVCDIRATDALIAAFTGLLVFVTGGLIFVGGWQVYYMRDTARRQLRAYIFISTAKITDIDSSETPEASLVIKNCGQTPAYDLTHLSGIAFREFPLTCDLLPSPIPNIRQTKLNISPNGEADIHCHALEPLNPQQKAVIKAGTHAFYVYGEVRYKDAFNKKHLTKFRFMQGGDAGVRGIVLAGCEEGNEAD